MLGARRRQPDVIRDLSKTVPHLEHFIRLVLSGCTVWVLQIGQRYPLAMSLPLLGCPASSR
jgi:hypothetical protein